MPDDSHAHPVIVVDLGTGNIGSVLKMLTRAGARPVCLCHPSNHLDSQPVVFPGVGHFGHAIKRLADSGWRGWLDEAHAADRAILGICLGAQLMCRSSEEGTGVGLGWVDAWVRRFPSLAADGSRVAVPHMGWQPFTPPASCLPFMPEHGRMYYAHSYYIEPSSDASAFPYQSSYGGVQFASVVRARRAVGVQFHPEKSHRYGTAFLRQWLQWAQTDSKR